MSDGNGNLTTQMADRVATLCDLVGDSVRSPMDDRLRRDWTYLPGQRTGTAIADMGREAAQAAMRLLAVGLRPHAYAQAATIMALEDVLDHKERHRGNRHRGDYWVAVFGARGVAPWGWRFEGHHLSVNWTVGEDGVVRATPQFLGANPARVEHAGAVVQEPLAREEATAIAVLQALGADQRGEAILPGDVPGDILTGSAASVDAELEPAGVALDELGGRAAELGAALLAIYQDRLPAGLPSGAEKGLRFAWAGGTGFGEPRYYRLQGRSLVIELDNTQNGANHVHSVLRDRHGDFGGDILRTHRTAAH